MAIPRSLARNFSILGLLGFLVLGSLAQTNPCIVVGIDFQDGGSYFQDSQSNVPFTFVQEFQGCQNDNSSNLIVGPSGDQFQCSDTPLLPDNTPEMSTCPLNKTQLVSGAWSVIVLSNNGIAEPIAYQRDFFLSVGPQQTTTVTPTVTLSATSTPILNVTSTTTDVTSTTLPAKTTTIPSTTIVPTKTVTPRPTTSTKTRTLFTITRVIPTALITKVTRTITPTCAVPTKPARPDKPCKILPTLPGLPTQAVAAVASSTAGPNILRYRPRSAKLLHDKISFLVERDAYLSEAGLVKRAPDEPVITITDPNTADYPTTTTTITAPPSTQTILATLWSTATITPPVVTVLSGRVVEPPITITAPQQTRVVTKYTVARTSITKTTKYTITITKTAKPAASVTACRRRGGHF